tara:strand:- start:23528 stop:24568 length:1041 start_codon:yes stop_codon:yes gene_type:complete
MKIKINNKLSFCQNQRPLIIAEISCNHKGDKKFFLQHIKLAKKSGADLIKIQTYRPQDMTVSRNFKIKSGIWKGMNLWNLYDKAHTPFEWHKDAFKLAKKLKIPLFSSPFSVEAVNFLEKNFNPPIYKIASFEITDLKLIKKIASLKKTIIISTGMANFKEINNALKIINKIHNKVIIMHCVSGYPTPETETNIRFIERLKKVYKKNLIGLSDHTKNIHSSLASIPLGVVAIEKHFIKSNNLKTFDSKFSLNPNMLKNLSYSLKKIYNCLGKEDKKDIKSETHRNLRRSIFTTKKIKKNEKITEKNINTFRPKVGICASSYFDVLGKVVKYDLKSNEPLHWQYLKK